jgi:prephenate dehydratase
MSKRISIQGYEGSFHQLAARSFFGEDVRIIPCATFGEVVKIAGDESLSEGGIMAIENSIAGSILANYALLQKSNLRIRGEVYLQIDQNLLANPGVTLEDIREVHSHPMALQQCLPFLDRYKWKLVETEDTALSARYIHQHKTKHIAAIAGKLAAELFDLNILAPKIQSEKDNYTRFLVLERTEKGEEGLEDGVNKASVHFHTTHSTGSLARVLTKIAAGGVNLSKLQSVPIPASIWKYSFHADMEFETPGQFFEVMESIAPLTEQVRIFGIYKKGKTILQ